LQSLSLDPICSREFDADLSIPSPNNPARVFTAVVGDECKMVRTPVSVVGTKPSPAHCPFDHKAFQPLFGISHDNLGWVRHVEARVLPPFFSRLIVVVRRHGNPVRASKLNRSSAIQSRCASQHSVLKFAAG
jgi:hypothetical protein